MITRSAIPLAALVLLLSCFGLAQTPGALYGRGPGGNTGHYGATLPAPPPPPIGRGLNFSGLNGQWWKNAEVVKKLGLSDSQVQQMEQIFQNHRLKLIDLHAALQREEVRMEPMLTADQPNESQVLAQIDKVAAERANLEKANAQMAFAIRRVLTPEQWKTLQSVREQRRGNRFGNQPRHWQGNRQGKAPNAQPGPPPSPAPAPAPQKQ